MADAKKTCWSAQDEAEWIRQEQRRLKEMRAHAFTAGFEAGAAFGISHGVEAMARIFEKTALTQKQFPPEIVKAFAASMIELAPQIKQTIIAGTKKARAEAAARKAVERTQSRNEKL